jgi:hypothetical protein
MFLKKVNIRRRLAVLTVVALLGFLLAMPFDSAAKEFGDVSSGHWASNDIDVMSNFGFVSGSPDGKFYPDNPVTRAEIAAMIVKSLRLSTVNITKQTFTDVNNKHWAYKFIEAVSKSGFMSGYKGKYRPNDKITRQEMAVVVMRISAKYGYPGDGTTSFLGKYKDMDQISPWAANDVSDASKFGYIKEVSYSVYESTYESYRYNQVLSPLNEATRAQAVSALYKMLTKTGLV